MTDWRRAFTDLTTDLRGEVAAHLRAARDVVQSRLDRDAPHIVAPYHGYGTRERWHVLARAVRAVPLAPARAEDSVWRNLSSMYQRLESDPLPAAQVRVRAGGTERMAVADDEGFVQAWLTPSAPADGDWQDAELELVSPRRDGAQPPAARARIRVPSPAARFLVVSDIDDTVLQSRITSLVQAVRTALLSNARTRLPFPGVSAFYRALERGVAGEESNPIFYLSSSPWNLFDVLAEFLEVQRLPRGPILLRDWDVSLDALGSASLQGFKRRHLAELLALYPSLPFILVGDTSQHDPEIYAEAVRAHPGRVLAVYIRDVSRHPERSAAIARLVAELEKDQVPLVVSEDTLGAARHAAERGWIDPAALREIEDDAAKDEGTVPGKEATV
jgi:phosphatidate phosphatase APP1